MQVPELVAGRHGRDHEIFGIPPIVIAPERRIGGARNRRLAAAADVVRARVRPVAPGPLSKISSPADLDRVVMLLAASHGLPSPRIPTTPTICPQGYTSSPVDRHTKAAAGPCAFRSPHSSSSLRPAENPR